MSFTTQKILIVEDEPIIAADLRDRLEDRGYHVIASVDTGEAALDIVRQQTPDVILMDVNLAGELDGVDTALAIRKLTDVALIFLTSNSDAVTFARARAALPQAFLSKPFRGRDLTNAIDLAIGAPTNTAASRSTPAPASAPLESTRPGSQPTPEDLPEGETAMVFQDRLFIKVKDRLTRLMIKDILWVEADDYYCKVVTEERKYLVTKTLKKLSALLPPTVFARCHRSYLVNLGRVTEIGEIYVFFGKRQVPVSRSKRNKIIAQLQNP
ncbi:LytR/AlgR family response regulator transcription factor [Neolewinella antarctica]|uniref:DNA-binding LytR/AlgR family response regulator n=1 Tax=Neolewinella antarctica TaxID=442734 RepID=A0ABX0XDN0_9BACT|nr:response regulator [Neolewinella antarctica]NJC27416.1 DNA-binding LytR/AlgR family response regulator [Neolewinella antarctica]